jgi:hypothetical protein
MLQDENKKVANFLAYISHISMEPSIELCHTKLHYNNITGSNEQNLEQIH